MEGASIDPTNEKLKQLKQLFPEAFTEGNVDWEKLKATLGEDINFANERYVLNWAGKSNAFKEIKTPTTKTLIPSPLVNAWGFYKNKVGDSLVIDSEKNIEKASYGDIYYILRN